MNLLPQSTRPWRRHSCLPGRDSSRPASVLLLLGLGVSLCAATNAPAPILSLVQTTELPGIEGDLDHLAIDTAGQRLFVCAEDNGTLRIIDLKTGKLVRTVKGFK